MPGGGGRMMAIPVGGAVHDLPKIDILFPVLHGMHGEDGAVQGLAEVAACRSPDAAYVVQQQRSTRTSQNGCSTRRDWRRRGRSPSPGETRLLRRARTRPRRADFRKPARQGSSVGVSKVATEGEFEAALAEGFKHDRKLLAEEFVRGREIECSVLEDAQGGLFVSRPGEIVPAESHGFYSYDAKYIDEDGAALKVPAELPPEIENSIREMAAKAFRAVGCDGMARVDFFVTADMRFSSTNSTPSPASPISACMPRRWRQAASAMPRSSTGWWSMGWHGPVDSLTKPSGRVCGDCAAGVELVTVARGTQSIGIRQAAA